MEEIGIINPVHQRITSEVIDSLDTFLKSFHSTLASNTANLTADLFVNFLATADRFNYNVSHKLTLILLEHSLEPDVRSAPEATLIRLIRNRCFESLDRILETYTGYLSQLNIDLRGVLNALTESRLRDALTGIEMPSGEAVKRYKLPTASREAALLLILEFLKGLQSVPDSLVDYAARRMGTSELDQDEQTRILSTIRTAIEEPFANALGFIENMDIIKRKRWEEQYAAENAIIQAVATASTINMAKRKSSAGSLFMTLIFLVPLWLISETGTIDLYAGVSGSISALMAIIFFYRAISCMAGDL